VKIFYTARYDIVVSGTFLGEDVGKPVLIAIDYPNVDIARVANQQL
jgi:hypothetical protein